MALFVARYFSAGPNGYGVCESNVALLIGTPKGPIIKMGSLPVRSTSLMTPWLAAWVPIAAPSMVFAVTISW